MGTVLRSDLLEYACKTLGLEFGSISRGSLSTVARTSKGVIIGVSLMEDPGIVRLSIGVGVDDTLVQWLYPKIFATLNQNTPRYFTWRGRGPSVGGGIDISTDVAITSHELAHSRIDEMSQLAKQLNELFKTIQNDFIAGVNRIR